MFVTPVDKNILVNVAMKWISLVDRCFYCCYMQMCVYTARHYITRENYAENL